MFWFKSFINQTLVRQISEIKHKLQILHNSKNSPLTLGFPSNLSSKNSTIKLELFANVQFKNFIDHTRAFRPCSIWKYHKSKSGFTTRFYTIQNFHQSNLNFSANFNNKNSITKLEIFDHFKNFINRNSSYSPNFKLKVS